MLPSQLGQAALLEMSKMEYFPAFSHKETCLSLCQPRVSPGGNIILAHTWSDGKISVNQLFRAHFRDIPYD